MNDSVCQGFGTTGAFEDEDKDRFFSGAAGTVSHPAHARTSVFQARILRAPGSVKGKKPLIRKQEEKNVLGSQKMECLTSLRSSDLALRLHHPDFVPCWLTCLCGSRGDLPHTFSVWGAVRSLGRGQ